MPANHEEVLYGAGMTTTYPTPETVVRTPSNYVRRIDIVERVSSTNGDFKKPSPASYRCIERNYPQGSEEYISKSEKLTTQLNEGNLGGIYDPYQTLASQIPNNENANYNRALEKLNDKVRGQLDLSTTALEYQQVRKMLSSSIKLESFIGNFIKAAKAAQRGKMGWQRMPDGTYQVGSSATGAFSTSLGDVPIRELMKDMGGNWLQWQYGLKPLLSDIHGAIQEIYTGVIPSVSRVHAKVYQPIVVNRLKDTLYESISKVNITGVQGVAFHVQFRPKIGFDIARWTSLNPVSWAWEMLTLSFVVDWVYDIGGMIRSAETAMLYDSTFDNGYVTYLRAWQAGIVVNGVFSNAFSNVIAKNTASSSYKDFRREVLGSWPIPRMPTFQLQLGAERLLSAASLLSQLLLRK